MHTAATAASCSPTTQIAIVTLALLGFLSVVVVLGPVAVAEVHRTVSDWRFARRYRGNSRG